MGGKRKNKINRHALVYRFENYTLDIERRELRSGDQPRHIEPQVFDLLHFLIENRERVVSRDDVFQAVWRGRIVSDAVLSTRINAVRKAIGDDGTRQRLLRTVHGRGFRFVGALIPDTSATLKPALNNGAVAIPPNAAATASDLQMPLVPTAWAEPVTEVCTALGYERAALYSMMNAPDKSTQDALRLKVGEASIKLDSILVGLMGAGAKAAAEFKSIWDKFKVTRDNETIPAIYKGRVDEAKIIAKGIQSARLFRMWAIMPYL